VSNIRRNRKMKSCLSVASSFHFGFKNKFDRRRFRALIFLFLFLSREKENEKE